MKYHACRRHVLPSPPRKSRHPCPASEAARKRLFHASEAKATSVKPAFVSIRGPVLHRRRWHRRLLRTNRERRHGRRAAECGQQFPPSDGDCHAPPRARCVQRTIPRHERAVFTFKEDRMLPPFTGGHSQEREADCEPANRACVTTSRRYCRACPHSWPQWLLLTKRLERRCSC